MGKPGSAQKTLCSTAYKYMFHACRIPQPDQDSYRLYDPAQHHLAIVAVRGHFYAIDLVDPTTGQPYAMSQLEEALSECVAMATTGTRFRFGLMHEQQSR
jgi:carnitine O-acetyltransferase